MHLQWAARKNASIYKLNDLETELHEITAKGRKSQFLIQ